MLLLPLLRLLYGQAPLATWSVPSGVVLTALGVALRTWAAGCLHKDGRLATGGPYALCRHPLYAGSGIIALGHGCMSALTLAPVLCTALWFWLYRCAMHEEDEFQAGLHGEQHSNYREQVPMVPFLPVRRRTGKTSGIRGSTRFSWSQVMRNREYEAVLVNTLAVMFYLWLHYRNPPEGP